MKHTTRIGIGLWRAWTAICLLSSVLFVSAYTVKDVETMSGAFSSAFYRVDGTNGWFKDTQTGGVSYFWTQAEMIETVIDAYEWTSNDIYRGMITNLLNGFLLHEGKNWGWNVYNDDIMWAVLAFARGGVLTGNSNYCNIAKANFDLCYARGWDTVLGGGFYWNTGNSNKNSAVNGPASIAASLLSQIFNDASYHTKAVEIFNWERTALYNPQGYVHDDLRIDGTLYGGATTYNQGTFLGAAHFLNETNYAAATASYTLREMTTGGILPQYGIAGNNSGFNAIFNRWLMRYMRDRNLHDLYENWFRTNAVAAWNIRRADNLAWCDLLQPSPAGVNFYSWDCISALSAMLAAPPTQVVSASPVPLYPIGYWSLDESSGAAAADSSGNNNTGAVTAGTWTSGGRVNGCLTFNGTSSQVEITNKLANDLSIAMWVKTTQTAGTPQWYNGVGLVDGDVPFNSNDFGTALVGGKFAFGVGNPDVTILSTNLINDGNWHLCVATREQASGTIKVYVDGVLENSGVGTKNTLNTPSRLLFGAISSGGHFFAGSLDEVRLYTRVLGAGEVAALYTSLMQPPATAPTNVLAVAGPGRIQLSWGDAAGATRYTVQRALTTGGPYTPLTNVAATAFTDTTVANNRTYYYIVSGANAAGEGPASAETGINSLPLMAWFKADAVTGLANGDAVSKWVDLTGNGYDAIQTIVSNRPTYVAGSLNGQPAVHFDAASQDYLWFYRPIQNDFTMVLVFRSGQGLNTGVNFWDGAGLVSGERPAPVNDFAVALNANGQILAGTGNPDRTLQSGYNFNNNQPHVVTFKRTRSTGAITLYVDGSVVSGNVGGTQTLNAPNFLVLGAQAVLNNFLTGDIAEVQLYGTPLSDYDRIGVEASLKCKYGIVGGYAPNPPLGLIGVADNRRVRLNWAFTPGATSYTLLRATGGVAFLPIASGLTASSYLDDTAVSGQTNYYRIAASDACGTGANSAAIGVYLPLPAMSVNAAAGLLEMSWPGWADDWQLMTATNLNPPVAWTPVPIEPVLDNGQFRVSVPMEGPAHFYRLAAP